MVREEDPEYGSYINVPILADPIAAGPPREVAEGDYTETVRVPIRFWRGGSYAMRVRGESMKPTFNEGDLVGISIFRGDPKALEGKIVAAWIVDEGLTVKQLRLVKGGGLLLQPLNPGSPPLYIGPQDVETVRLFRVDWWLGHQE
jgi:SOS-response transcriptional repressor LexA